MESMSSLQKKLVLAIKSSHGLAPTYPDEKHAYSVNTPYFKRLQIHIDMVLQYVAGWVGRVLGLRLTRPNTRQEVNLAVLAAFLLAG